MYFRAITRDVLRRACVYHYCNRAVLCRRVFRLRGRRREPAFTRYTRQTKQIIHCRLNKHRLLICQGLQGSIWLERATRIATNCFRTPTAALRKQKLLSKLFYSPRKQLYQQTASNLLNRRIFTEKRINYHNFSISCQGLWFIHYSQKIVQNNLRIRHNPVRNSPLA